MTREEERLGAALDFYDKHTSAASHVTLVDSFVYGSKWADKTTIDKVCEILRKTDTIHYMENGRFLMEKFVEDIRKAMGE